MAVVRDDGGRVQGLITMEDVLEEIVGEIEDEHDRPTPRLRLKAPSPGYSQNARPGALPAEAPRGAGS
jgi:Mg2+/Co2+ transporter CorC